MGRLREKYDNVFNGSDTAAVEAHQIKSRAVLQSFSTTQGEAAQKEVDTLLMAGRLASAINIATSALSSDPASRETAMEQALAQAEYAVMDPTLGMAVRNGVTDPALIARMVQTHQGAVVSGVVDRLLSTARQGEAAALVDKETGPGGRITDPTEASKLITKLLPYRQEIKNAKNFSAIISNAPMKPDGSPSLLYVHQQIAAELDPITQAGLFKELGKYTQGVSIKLIELQSNEMQGVIKAIQAGQSITLSMIPTLMLHNPAMAQALLQGRGPFNLQKAADANDQASWEAKNGGKTFNPTVDAMMANLQKSNPEQWLAILDKGHLNGMINYTQALGYEKLKEVVKFNLHNNNQQGRVDLNKILSDLGVSQKLRREALITRQGSSLVEAVNRVRAPGPDGKLKPDYAQIKAAVAQALLRVRTEDNFWTPDQWDHTASPAVTALGGDVRTMVLQDSHNNIQFTAAVLRVDGAVVSEAFKKLPTDQRTLSGVSAHLKVPLPADPNSVANRFDNTVNTLAVQEGLPPGFINFLLLRGKKGDGTPYKRTPEDVVLMMETWEKDLPNKMTKHQAMLKWLGK